MNEHITNALQTQFPSMLVDVAPNTVITTAHGFESAVLVSSYPYGSLRCVMAYYLEYKAGKGTRFVSRTVNPKKAGIYWNAPKASTYTTGVCVLGTDANGHVKRWDLSDMIFYQRKDDPAFLIDEFERKFAAALTENDRKVIANLRAYDKLRKAREAAKAAETNGWTSAELAAIP